MKKFLIFILVILNLNFNLSYAAEAEVADDDSAVYLPLPPQSQNNNNNSANKNNNSRSNKNQSSKRTVKKVTTKKPTANKKTSAQKSNANNKPKPLSSLERGIALMKQERYNEAYPYLQKAIQENRKDPNAWYWYGKYHEAIGGFSQAQYFYTKAVECDPNFVPLSRVANYPEDQNKTPLWDPKRPARVYPVATTNNNITTVPPDSKQSKNLASRPAQNVNQPSVPVFIPPEPGASSTGGDAWRPAIYVPPSNPQNNANNLNVANNNNNNSPVYTPPAPAQNNNNVAQNSQPANNNNATRNLQNVNNNPAQNSQPANNNNNNAQTRQRVVYTPPEPGHNNNNNATQTNNNQPQQRAVYVPPEPGQNNNNNAQNSPISVVPLSAIKPEQNNQSSTSVNTANTPDPVLAQNQNNSNWEKQLLDELYRRKYEITN